MKTGYVADAFKALEKATVSELTAEERIQVVKAMKAMRATAKEYDAFVDDLREKFRTPNLDAIVQKIQTGKGLTEAEAAEFMEYNNPVSKAIEEEREREVEIDVPKIPEEVVLKMIGENKWKLAMLETFNL